MTRHDVHLTPIRGSLFRFSVRSVPLFKGVGITRDKITGVLPNVGTFGR